MIRASVVVLCLVSLALCAEVSLDGEWQLCRTATGERPGDDAKWEPAKVPSFVEQAADMPFLWYRRTLRVPSDWKEPHIFLRFGGAKFVSTVFVNGQEAGGHFGGWEPFEVEITKHVRREGDNQLLVRVQDVTGVVAEPLALSPKRRGHRSIERARDSVMAPVGSQPNRIGLWQPVSLIARGDVYVQSVFVTPSVRRKELEVELTLRNLAAEPRTPKLLTRVLNWPDHVGAPVLDLGTLTTTLAASSTRTHTMRARWDNPRLWSLDSPALYVLSVLFVPSTQGEKPGEAASIRFGFREFWTEGPHLVLNGTRMKFLATAGHPRGNLDDGLSKEAALDFYRRIREAGCVAMRLHANVWPEAWYEAADEVGMPIIMESALFCNPQQYALTKPEFWKNYADHLAAIIRHKRNHPSIVMYSLENEILHCGGEHFAKDCERRLAEAGRMVKRIDPTRPIMYDADGDPEGVADVVNLHYSEDFDANNLWPNCAWWLEKGMKVHGWPHKFFAWDRKKPLYFGEFLHLQHYQTADPYTTLLGDDAYRGHDYAMAHCKAQAWEMQIQAYRGCDVSGMCPWTLTETGDFPSKDNPRYLAVKHAYQPIAAFIRERDNRFYAAETVARTVDLYNDTPHPAKLTVEWELRGEDNKVVDSGRRNFDTEPAQRVPFTLQFRMPQAARWPLLEATLRVRQGEKLVFQDTRDIVVYARQKLLVPAGQRIAIYEAPGGALGPLLREAGARVETVRDLAELPQADVLLVGPHALDTLKPPEGVPAAGEHSGPREALAAFVRAGGTVVVLEQDSYACGILPARLIDRGCTIAFARGFDPLWFRSVERDQLCFWRGDHLVARKTIAKPQHGRFVTLADSGGPDGLVYLPALEVLDGKGSYLLCQLLIGEKLGTEPMAQRMLENFLYHAAAMRNAERKPEKLAVVHNKPAMGEALDEVGVVAADVTGKLAATDLSAFGVLLAEADAPEVAQNVQKLRSFVEAGGVLVLHAGTHNGVGRLQKLFPQPLIAQPNASIPVNIATWDPTINGLTNQELYWYGDRSGLRWDDRTPLSAEVCDHVIVGGLPDPRACRTFEAEAMAATHGQPQVRGGEVYMFINGSIKTSVEFPKEGEYAFVVRGKGTPVGGVYPQIAVSVDARPVGSVSTASEEWGEYSLTANVAAGKHEVSLAFVNDAWNPEKGEDRNVSLDWLRVGPVPPMKAKRLLNPPALVKVELGDKGGFILLDQVRWDKRPGDQRAMRYLSNILTNLNCDFRSPVGVLTLSGDAFKPKGDLKLASWRAGVVHMGTNGTVATRVRFAKSRRYEFAVRAEGTQAGGQWPNVALSIDGARIGDAFLRRPGWHTIQLEAKVAEGEREVGLSFTNDFYDTRTDPPADRNLRIAELAIR